MTRARALACAHTHPPLVSWMCTRILRETHEACKGAMSARLGSWVTQMVRRGLRKSQGHYWIECSGQRGRAAVCAALELRGSPSQTIGPDCRRCPLWAWFPGEAELLLLSCWCCQESRMKPGEVSACFPRTCPPALPRVSGDLPCQVPFSTVLTRQHTCPLRRRE